MTPAEIVDILLEGKYAPWIGVDLDQTLSEGPMDADGGIGEPNLVMMLRVHAWLQAGKKVKIMTARAAEKKNIPKVKKWLKDNGLPDLEVTNEKDPGMEELWDDKARQVVPDTGLEPGQIASIELVGLMLGEAVGGEPWTMGLSDWSSFAGRGKVNKATGRTSQREKDYERQAGRNASALGYGVAAGYSMEDIAAFYVRRRSGYSAEAYFVGYCEFIRDAIDEGYPVSDAAIEAVFNDGKHQKWKKKRNRLSGVQEATAAQVDRAAAKTNPDPSPAAAIELVGLMLGEAGARRLTRQGLEVLSPLTWPQIGSLSRSHVRRIMSEGVEYAYDPNSLVAYGQHPGRDVHNSWVGIVYADDFPPNGDENTDGKWRLKCGAFFDLEDDGGWVEGDGFYEAYDTVLEHAPTIWKQKEEAAGRTYTPAQIVDLGELDELPWMLWDSEAEAKAAGRLLFPEENLGRV